MPKSTSEREGVPSVSFDESAPRSSQGGFSLVESVLSVALIAVALLGALSVTKVLGQDKELVENRTNFQLASQSLNNNIALQLQESDLADVVPITQGQVMFMLGSNCPSTSTSNAFRNMLQSELCQIRFFKKSTTGNGAPPYRVELTNMVEDGVGTNKYLRLTVSFFNLKGNALEFQRVFLHVR